MLVSSRKLETTANHLVDKAGIGELEAVILRNGAKANARQLRKAAYLLRDAEPSICNSVKEERPGYIKVSEDEGILVFSIGILSSSTYKINREGALVDD